ncbi:ion transporter [Mycoplasma phocimorsus]|uniref:ion transporter n=1 Tax=Mycoplasma phocimorsus TaxID=3045839 RepID=UPI0024BFE1AE|nr:ion transporter [Mycoplasma phocimorsus]MDJ1648276.1 ion transporter [Mycoplasma phocimorsus]
MNKDNNKNTSKRKKLKTNNTVLNETLKKVLPTSSNPKVNKKRNLQTKIQDIASLEKTKQENIEINKKSTKEKSQKNDNFSFAKTEKVRDKDLAYNIFEYVVNPSQKTTKIQSSYVPLAIILKFVYVLGIIVPYFLSLSVLLFGTIFKDEQGNPSLWVKAMSLAISTIIFFIAMLDYIMIYIYKVRSSKRKVLSAFLFPFSFKGFLLFLIIFSTIATPISIFGIGAQSNLEWLRHIKYLSYLRVIRVILLLSFFTPFKVLYTVIDKEKKTLFYIFLFIIFVIISFSIIFYDVEPLKFNYTTSDVMVVEKEIDGELVKKVVEASTGIEATPADFPFWNAIYFTTVTMTSIGYGDITLVSVAGRISVIILSLMGIAIFAIPSGIIAGGFVSELKQLIDARKEIKDQNKEQ